MKLYPVILVPEQELADAGIGPLAFRDGKLAKPEVTEEIENYCGRPVVAVRQTTKPGGDLVVITADGYIQRNPVTGRRTAVLIGSYDALKVVLTDIFEESPTVDPDRIFRAYAYQVDVVIQHDLLTWVKNEYRPAWADRMRAMGYDPDAR